jgi:acyl carrier protein
MDEQQTRLANCFMAVFPELSTDEICAATSVTVHGWDSVAGVTLMAVVEEEFGITLEIDDLAQFDSFNGFLGYIRETEVASRS